MSAQDDLLEQGFQLACFIFPERATALRILSGAMNKLKVQRGRENRRAYWRDKHLKRGITRITRDEGDTLQWLILFESDQHEIEQEQRNAQSLNDMVLRFVKLVVRAGTGMSSFYANVGMHRLLHNYSTSDTQRIYETLTDRYLGADEYRRAKSALVSKLLDRFDPFLITGRGPRGELRFDVENDQTHWMALVDACLKAFTPWSTAHACPLPNDFNQKNLQLPAQLTGRGNGIDPDQVELNRCHAVIDPVCHNRLLEALGFAPLEEKLAIPRFNMESERQDPGSRPGSAGLTPGERKSVQSILSQQADRRAKARPDSARVLVDGVERARVSLRERNQRSFVIQEGAEFIELWGESQGEDLLLAVHRIAYDGEHGMAAEDALLFQNRGRRLALAVVPEALNGDTPGRATVRLESHPSSSFGWLPAPGGVSSWKWAAAQLLAGAMFLGIGWFMGSRLQEHRPAGDSPLSVVHPTPQPTPAQQAMLQAPEEKVRPYRLVPDELLTRSGQGVQIPAIVLTPETSLLHLELPVSLEDSRRTFRVHMKKFGTNEEILVENLLVARLDHQVWIIEFQVPSRLLKAGEDYAIGVRARNSGTQEELASYMFHAK